MSKTLTVETLKSKKACQPQIDLFRSLFGDSVEVTEELCVKHAQDFNWDWAADTLLSESAREDYYKATGPALKVYNKATAPALKVYIKATASAWARAYLSDN